MSKAVKQVSRALQKLYPLELADSSWDNTGLLLDASNTEDAASPRVLLTIDLTAQVAREAINGKHNIIVAYHPFIFRPLKQIVPQNSQQNSLLSLVRAGISVYCPHTAVDAAVGGVNDWLCDGISGGSKNEKSRIAAEPATRQIEGHEQGGMGREVKLVNAITIEQAIERVKALLKLQTVQLVRPDGANSNAEIASFAVCAGSGGSVLRNSKTDLIVTGELGHHEMLAIKEKGRFAIVAGHSNTERGFLETVKQQLSESLADASVDISKEDRDPIEYV